MPAKNLIQIIDDEIERITMNFIILSSSVDYDKSMFVHSLYSELIYELEILREKSMLLIKQYDEEIACTKIKDILENKILTVSTLNGYYAKHAYERLYGLVDKRILDFDKE